MAGHTGGNPKNIHKQGQAAQDGDLRAFRFDRVELTFLSLSRRIFEAISTDMPEGWKAARATARAAYGCGGNDPVLNATLDVIDAMRRLRATAFNYRKDSCACCRSRITAEERLLVSALHNLRRGKRSRAYVQTMLLVQGEDPSALLVALEFLDYTLFEMGLSES